MGVILVSDIFGKTPALIKLAKELNAEYIIDPYNGNDMAFKNEADAYVYFSDKVGLDVYYEHLKNSLNLLKSPSSLTSPKVLIGFSVGASVIWRLSAIMTSDDIKNSFCFYGSQIRNFTEIVPKFDVTMIFPAREDHFDVLALQEKIEKKTTVRIIGTDYFHGFMNSDSSNYNKTAYRKHIDLLRLSTL